MAKLHRMAQIYVQQLSSENLDEIVLLTKHLNPNIEIEVLKKRQLEMFQLDHFICFGIYKGQKLIGVSGGWITVRLYSGKQLEIDNFIIDPDIQSNGYGQQLLDAMQNWALTQNCETIELNTYVQNSRSHKFYYRNDFSILGFHFQKKIN